MTIHAQIIKRKGEKEFVVIPYKEFIRICETIEDYMDLKELRKAKNREKNKPTISLKEAEEKLGLL